MNIWILTIGSSDVQLKPKNNWTNLFRAGRGQLKPDRGFSPHPIPDSDRLRVPARVMGVIYSQPQASLDDLDFPLIDNFINKLKAQKIAIDQVILVLSDQSVFPETKRSQKHPYWQDTCTLQPILKKYLAEQWKDVSPDLEIQLLLLEAASEAEGLDNWDAVLTLVQQGFVSPALDLPDDATIYVSHQAGTPAISSAVQFCSLAKFGDRVKFLVSNEYNPTFPEKPLEGSSYLRGIRIQEAKALLGESSYNYAGVEALISDYIEDNPDIKALLNAAKNWNVAKFRDFIGDLKHYPKLASEVAERTREENWWWIAYEEAYLAVVREKQDNIVEAFFHSFRAFEYIFSAWSRREFGGENSHIEEDKGKFYLKRSVLDDDKDYFAKAKFKQNGDPRNDLAKLKCLISEKGGALLDLSTICKLFRVCRDEYENDCQEIEIFWDQKNDKENNVSEKRNVIMHQAQGMSNDDLQSFWTAREESDEFKEKSWAEKLLVFLNFIVKEDFPDGFATLEEASLMAKVHTELVEAIAHL